MPKGELRNFIIFARENGVGAEAGAGLFAGKVGTNNAVLSHISKGKLPRDVRILLPDSLLNSEEVAPIAGLAEIPLRVS
jgi:hypothetical protein